MFESGEDREVNNGLIIMNEFIVPFLPLLLVDEMEEKDILAVEDMRNRWCSYLGQEMECKFEQCVRHLRWDAAAEDAVLFWHCFMFCSTSHAHTVATFLLYKLICARFCAMNFKKKISYPQNGSNFMHFK